MIANTHEPPYYAVLFTSIKTGADQDYTRMAERMTELAQKQDGFLGVESARNEIGITVSYWRDLESIKKWKQNTEHQHAQKLGKEKWYSQYKVRICRIEHDYCNYVNID